MITWAIARICSGMPSSIFSPVDEVISPPSSLAAVRRVSTKPKTTA